MGIFTWLDLIKKSDNSDSVDWKEIFNNYCELIEESNFLHNQYYYYLNNNDYKMIDFYEKKIEEINNKIQGYINMYPCCEQQYNRYL